MPGKPWILLAALAFLPGCGSETEDEKDDLSSRKLRIVATTGMVADAVRHVGGDRLEVTALMGPGVDPHLFKASAGDVDRLRGADLIVYNGLHLEAKMGTVLKHMDVIQLGDTMLVYNEKTKSVAVLAARK